MISQHELHASLRFASAFTSGILRNFAQIMLFAARFLLHAKKFLLSRNDAAAEFFLQSPSFRAHKRISLAHAAACELCAFLIDKNFSLRVRVATCSPHKYWLGAQSRRSVRQLPVAADPHVSG